MVPRRDSTSFRRADVQATVTQDFAQKNSIAPFQLPTLNRQANVTVPTLAILVPEQAGAMFRKRRALLLSGRGIHMPPSTGMAENIRLAQPCA